MKFIYLLAESNKSIYNSLIMFLTYFYRFVFCSYEL